MSSESTTLLIRLKKHQLERWRKAARKADITVSDLVRDNADAGADRILGPEVRESDAEE